jgi:FkbH-like protein
MTDFYTPLTLAWPIDMGAVARRGKARVTYLRSQPVERKVRIAILGGSTIEELMSFLEIMLLERGIDPEFWQSGFGRYWEDAVLNGQELASFAPEIVYLHTGSHNIRRWPSLTTTEEEIHVAAQEELDRYTQIWDALSGYTQANIIQSNFELPDTRLLGNLDAVHSAGRVRFTDLLNQLLVSAIRERSCLILNDVRYIAARIGLDHWYSPSRWLNYKITVSPLGSAAVAHNLASLIAAHLGLGKKGLILDLDNTLWGGVVGEEGIDGIVIGPETPLGEAYTRFQEQLRELARRGIILAVASKNDDEIARAAFDHPASVLTINDFASFKANWKSKDENILEIAKDLDLDLDSLVFIDDNPVERELIAHRLPTVVVPPIGDDPATFFRYLDRGQYFECIQLSSEDLVRSSHYRANAKRREYRRELSTSEEFLAFLDMTADCGSFIPVYFERIAQLTARTNQFNLTGRRCSQAEIAKISTDPRYVTRYIRLHDRFGDNGIVSVAIGRSEKDALHLDLWLMSCRVLKRDVELLMLDQLVQQAVERGLPYLQGYYRSTNKNHMVSSLYKDLGFRLVGESPDSSHWLLDLDAYKPKNLHIHPKS